MEKRTLYALIAVLAVGALALMVQRAPQKGQRKGPPPRPVAELKAADIAKLELTNDKQQHTLLEKASPDEWRVKQPGDWKADQTAVKQLLDALGKLSFADTVTENPAKHEELGVADGKGAHLVVKDAGGKTLADLLIGKSVGGFTMLRVAGQKEVWQVTGLYPYSIGREPSGWRDHIVMSFPFADVEKLSVESPGQKVVLQKLPATDKDKPNDVKWKLLESAGAAPKAGEPIDDQQASAAAQGLSNLHAVEFADDKKPADVIGKGLAVTLTATVKGQPHTVSIGEAKGDELYVVTGDSPTVYLIKKYGLDHIARRPIDYRDKTLAKIKSADLTSIEIVDGGETTTLTQKDGKWSAGKGVADEAKVKPVAAAFENLQADGFADEHDPAKTGLAKPTGQVVVQAKGQTVTLKIGSATKDGDYYVAKVGSPDLYRVKKYAVDRFFKKPADLVKK